MIRNIILKPTGPYSLKKLADFTNDRIIGNLGFGYRFLNSDQSMMFGANAFYDQDLSEDHKRVGFGLEAKASMLNFNYNQYQKATNQKIINTKSLIVPHPRWYKRMFVLISLKEVNPNLVLPLQSQSVKKLYKNLNSNQEVKLYAKKW